MSSLTWQSPRGSRPRLRERDVPHEERGEAHERPEGRISDTNEGSIDLHVGGDPSSARDPEAAAAGFQSSCIRSPRADQRVRPAD